MLGGEVAEVQVLIAEAAARQVIQVPAEEASLLGSSLLTAASRQL